MISGLKDLTFLSPMFFLLLLLIPLAIWWKHKRLNIQQVSLLIPDATHLESALSWKEKIYPYLDFLKLVSFVLFVIALARPQLTLKEEEQKAEGIDIIMVLDISSSMLAQDFKPDRLEVSKKVAQDFIDKRPYDRIGLVVFSGESFTQCPLTTDHFVVKEFLSNVECGLLDDGTAIGMGLASAVNRLKDSESESKVVILLTDGVNNSGSINPLTSAEIAKEMDTKVYTIGVGSIGQALSPVSRRNDGKYVFGMTKVEIDENLLTQISNMTNGKYYRAVNEQSLQEIYNEIDELEKTEIQVTVFKRYSEEFYKFLALGLLIFGLDFVLRRSLFNTLP